MQVCFYSPFGHEGCVGDVEVDLRRGIPMVDIVGLADGSVRQAREGVRSAIRSSGFEFPSGRVLVSLSPADFMKEGNGFSLPVALAVLQESEKQKTGRNFPDDKVLVLGGLLPDGRVERVHGIFAALQDAKEKGIKHAIVPVGFDEKFPEGIDVRVVSDLGEAWGALTSVSREAGRGPQEEEVKKDVEPGIRFPSLSREETTLDGLKGGAYPLLKRAMALAVAGGHNMLAVGSPGCGKSLAMKCMPEIMPLLSSEEQASVSRLYSLAGLFGSMSVHDGERPFRMPHQSANLEGMFGGGKKLLPGEVSLAHHGVLFLDEASEFKTSVLRMLRVPSYSGAITLSRYGRSTVFPANFRLAMAASPCPCGNSGSHDRTCLCSASSVSRYWDKLGGPLLDFVEVRADVNAYLSPDNKRKLSDISVADMRGMIGRAWKAQHERQGKMNGKLTRSELDAQLSPDVRKWFEGEEARTELPPSSGVAVLRLARTIADMTGERDVSIDRIKEAFDYHADVSRQLEKKRGAEKEREPVSRGDDDGWGY